MPSQASNKTSKMASQSLKYLIRALIVIFATGFGLILFVISVYVWNFGGALSPDHSTWGEFGDFVGGILNPSLSFLGLIALLLTLWVQSRELRHSIEELQLARDQLERSAQAQENSERALAAHARAASLAAQIEAATRLIENIDRRVKEINMRGSNVVVSNEMRDSERQLPQKRAALVKRISAIYDELSAS